MCDLVSAIITNDSRVLLASELDSHKQIITLANKYTATLRRLQLSDAATTLNDDEVSYIETPCFLSTVLVHGVHNIDERNASDLLRDALAYVGIACRVFTPPRDTLFVYHKNMLTLLYEQNKQLVIQYLSSPFRTSEIRCDL